MRYRFHTADVFTDRVFGGNPLAVFPEAQGLTTEQMQRIAGELNLSETAFVLPPETPTHSHRLRIFTPRYELPFAGHPTIGSACVLAANGIVALAAHLGARSGVRDGTLRWTVVQGVDMGRRSVLRLEAERRGGETIGIRVGGAVVRVSDGLMEIPGV